MKIKFNMKNLFSTLFKKKMIEMRKNQSDLFTL